jgi:NitT/TauT family transport system permease protein
MNEALIIVLAVLATTGRVLALITLSIVSGWILAYGAIKNRVFENLFIAFVEIFESVPVITFFPLVLIIFVANIGGSLGVELAADFLVFTAVVWNIWIGEYQAFKTIPKEMIEIAENYNYGLLDRLSSMYIPFSIPRIAANLFPSVADGFFYISVSEVFTVGLTSYSTFGVGSLLLQFLDNKNYVNIALTMTILGIIIILIVLAMRVFTNRAVAKYTVDTDMPIMRRGRPRLKQSATMSAVMSINPLVKLAKYNRQRQSRVDPEDLFSSIARKSRAGIIVGLVGILLLGYLSFEAYVIISSVSSSQWSYLFSQTPSLLYGLLLDYLRVLTITVASLVFAITVGYLLATRRKVESVGIPAIQAISSYPVPVYFPFVFIALYPITTSILGPHTEEAFVLVLGFLSTFYYVFYGFWMGMKAMPVEYNEIMRNMDMSFFKKLRYVILPSSFPYLITGISSTMNSAWGGLEIAEFWPGISSGQTLQVHQGLMKSIDVATKSGNIMLAAWASFLFAIVVAIYSILFTKKMMDLAKKKYVAEEGIYST